MKNFSLNVNINQLLDITKMNPDQRNLTFIFNVDEQQVSVYVRYEELIDFIKYITVNSTGKPDVR